MCYARRSLLQENLLNGRKGQVTFIHSHCVHGSEPNTSDTRFRKALLGGYLKDGAHFNEGNHMKRKPIDVYSLQKKYWG